MFLKNVVPVVSYKLANTRWISHKIYSTSCRMSTMSCRLDSPWLMLPPSFKDDNEMVYNFYSLSENKVLSFNKRDPKDENPTLSPPDDSKIVGSSHGWLALFDPSTYDFYLSNPLTRRHIKLPPMHNLPNPQVNLIDSIVSHGRVSKLIISGSPHEDECRAIMNFGWTDTMAFCSPGRPTTEWTSFGNSLCEPLNKGDDPWYARSFEDFVYSARQKLFFCLTEQNSDELEGWDLTDPNSPRIDWLDETLLEDEYYPWLCKKKKSLALEKYYCRRLRYLVFSEESNRLFLVTRHLVEEMAPDGSCVEVRHDGELHRYKSTNFPPNPYKTIGFDVHEIDREGRRLNYLEGCLDGMAMFVGHNHSFLISGVGDGDGIKPNSIYFTDDKEVTPRKWHREEFGGHDIGIFDNENKTISSCYYPCDLKSFTKIVPAPIWFTPSLH
ncbi:hypothetical protein CASFOL_019342 [Castilleja foliolosa]|uniref:KIB1-4 beta-propeller domain-containing protein n=1 Tax=Castilleja foliolosa TaxID=1961234 RepID=A0ABD3D442_9LAMI